MNHAFMGFVLCVVFILCATPAFAAGRAVTLASNDGTQLTALLYEPSSRPSPAVVLVHMLGRTKEDWQTVADRLEEAGIMVLAIDLRGHGRSSGSMATLTPMVGDVTSAVTWLSTRPDVRRGAVAIVGASLGANLAALAAAALPAVRALVLVSPSLDYRGLRLDASTMKRIGDRPVLMLASAQDPYALRTLRELMTEGSGREQRLGNPAAHGTNLLAADPDLSRGLVEWLRRVLGP